MRIAVKVFRTTRVLTAHVKKVVGLEIDAPNDQASDAVKKTFGPHMVPGFKIFWPEPAGHKNTIVGIEALGFDAPVPTGLPQGCDSLILCDPLDAQDTARLDGALRAELMRMGIWTDADDYEWRIATSVKA